MIERPNCPSAITHQKRQIVNRQSRLVNRKFPDGEPFGSASGTWLMLMWMNPEIEVNRW
jgi:hypothetical protein